MKTSILIIYTGGTIGMKTDPVRNVLVPFDFNDIYEEFPSVRMLGIDIDVVNFSPIDSSNVDPELWVKLADTIYRNYDKYDGFVVLHGTDTMSYTASALSFMCKNLRKPIVFTGSQIPIGVLRTDGRENLITALEIAAAKKNGYAVVPEVVLYFQNKLFRANRSRKYSAEELDAFTSDNYPPLAEVGVNITYNTKYINSFAGNGEFSVDTTIEKDILILKIFPGISEHILRSVLGDSSLKGIILETYGAGNAPTFKWFTDIIKETVERGVVVLNVTQCHNGRVAMDIYETGKELSEAGVISGYDSTTEAAVTKLMTLLGKGLKKEELSNALNRSLRGEITK